MSPDDPRERTAALLVALNARAAGVWRVEPGRLVLLAFAGASDLDPAVADRFTAETRSVPLDRIDLGIVRAVVEGGVAVSKAESLPADVGSGRWLRAFGASRSVAVPLGREAIRAVFSIALPESPLDDEAVAAIVRHYGAPLAS